jgi:hypothetical protein
MCPAVVALFQTAELRTSRRENKAVRPFKDEAQTSLFKDPVRTALETLFISAIKTHQLML